MFAVQIPGHLWHTCIWTLWQFTNSTDETTESKRTEHFLHESKMIPLIFPLTVRVDPSHLNKYTMLFISAFSTTKFGLFFWYSWNWDTILSFSSTVICHISREFNYHPTRKRDKTHSLARCIIFSHIVLLILRGKPQYYAKGMNMSSFFQCWIQKLFS